MTRRQAATGVEEGSTPQRPKRVLAPPLPGQEAEERRRQVVAAALVIFLDKGYYGARMDDIAAAAGMSKRTIYQMFASKEALFEALLAERMAPVGPCKIDPAQPLEVAIAELVYDCASWVLSAGGIAITRLIMGEYARSPELGRLLKKQGYKRFMVSLEKCLSLLAETGDYRFEDVREAARMLIGMVVGDVHYDLLIGVGQGMSKTAIRRRADRAIRILLDGSRVR